MSFGRQQVADILQSSDIHPAFCMIRDDSSNILSAEEEFTLNFFLNCSIDDLFCLNGLAKSKPQCKEIFVKFSSKMSGINSPLSVEEMENFVFSEHEWKAKILKGEWNHFCQPSKATLMVTFY